MDDLKAKLARPTDPLQLAVEAFGPFAKAAEAYIDEKTVIASTPSSELPNYYITARDLFVARQALGASHDA